MSKRRGEICKEKKRKEKIHDGYDIPTAWGGGPLREPARESQRRDGECPEIKLTKLEDIGSTAYDLVTIMCCLFLFLLATEELHAQS